MTGGGESRTSGEGQVGMRQPFGFVDAETDLCALVVVQDAELVRCFCCLILGRRGVVSVTGSMETAPGEDKHVALQRGVGRLEERDS
jgi:hypothetical protein